VDLASNLQRHALETMYAMRGYAFTKEEKYLTDGRQQIAEVKKWLQQCQELADRSEHLVTLKAAVKICADSMAVYEELVNQTVAKNQAVEQIQTKLNAAAQDYMKDCSEFLASQNEAFAKDVAEDRRKIRLIADISALLAHVHAAQSESQVQNRPELMEQTISQLDSLRTLTDQLRSFLQDAADVQTIDGVESGTAVCRSSLLAFVEEQKKGTDADRTKLAKHRQDMDAAADLCIQHCATITASQQEKGQKALLERNEKITQISDIIDLGNAMRIACWKAQAMRDVNTLRSIEANFASIVETFENLRKITRTTVNLQQIDRVLAAAQSYKAEVNALVANWTQVDQISVERGKAADSVLKAAEDITTAGIQQTTDMSQSAASALSVSALVMIIGLTTSTRSRSRRTCWR
jgi:methyl-accepting chemotaxis protein